MKYIDRTFEDEDIALDGHAYENCIFRRVQFSYSAISGLTFSRCGFYDCRWTLTGPAGNTVAFLSATYNGMGEAGRILVDKTFDDIRRGSTPRAQVEITYKPRIFIGHGRSADYGLLKVFLVERGYEVVNFESEPRAGLSAKDVVEDMSRRASMAFLVHTAEDEQHGQKVRARENVVHETGLFQGRLGFRRAIVVREEGCEPFSNLDGIQYIPYRSGYIKDSFMDVLDTIQREFPSAN